MLSEEDENGLRLHVPPVEHFNGFVDGQSCEITWVSNDRQRVRVRFDNHQVRKRHASTWIDRTSFRSFGGSPRSATSRFSEDNGRHAETFYTPEEIEEREQASTKMQAVARGISTRKDLAKQAKITKEVEYKRLQQKRLLETKTRDFLHGENDNKHSGFEQTIPADRIKKVTMKGDESWMNRWVCCTVPV